MVHMSRSEDSLQELVLSSYHVGHQDWTLTVRLGSQRLYPLSRLTNPMKDLSNVLLGFIFSILLGSFKLCSWGTWSAVSFPGVVVPVYCWPRRTGLEIPLFPSFLERVKCLVEHRVRPPGLGFVSPGSESRFCARLLIVLCGASLPGLLVESRI